MRNYRLWLCVVGVVGALPLFAADAERYALILTDPPVARLHSRNELESAAAIGHRQTIVAAQTNLRGELERRGFVVTGAVQNALNAVFVQAPNDRISELQQIPGVKAVIRVHKVHLLLNAAVNLVNAPVAWNAVGGEQNAGRGVKIGMIDTGIDQNHAAFQDASLPMPAGFPKCNVPSYCAFTNNKVIVARSYVSQPGTAVDPTQSHPDDPTPRDRIGHGTATAMVAAGETNTGPSATITGMAPKAYLGNYKVFGSSFNPFATDQEIIQALDDALSDGMDIVSMSLGGPALSGPLDAGPICGNPVGTPCDLEAAAVENLTRAGVTVVAAAGNEGDLNEGGSGPAYDTIDSPGYTPSAIAVGGVTNSHFWENGVHVAGSGVPSNLKNMAALFGDGPMPVYPLTAPGIDVTKAGNDGWACTALRAGSLIGGIALVERGSPPSGPSGCTFLQKVENAQNAGAVGVIIYDDIAGEDVFNPSGLSTTQIPAVLINNADGLALKQFLDAHSGQLVTIDSTFYIAVPQQPDLIATFSSRGPATGTGAIKPELLAVGTDLYMAAESTDPTGELFSPDGYIVSQGTSFSTPMVAGAAALVKQKHASFTPAQIKSAVVNTANSSGIQDEFSTPVHVMDMGAGMLDAGAAVASNIAIQPATLSFGIVSKTLPAAQQLQVTNTGAASVNLTFSVNVLGPDNKAHVSLDKSGMALTPGQTGVLTASVKGTLPTPGIYDGFVNIQGGSTRLNVPYLYLVGDGVPVNIVPLLGDQNDGTVKQPVPDGAIVFQVTDQFGVPVSGAAPKFSVVSGGGSIQQPSANTDANGIAGAGATYGSQPGPQVFQGQVAGLTVTFNDTARLLPVISPGGAVDAATFQAGQGVAPGSYISLFGVGLSDDTRVASTVSLPLSIDGASVSFDVPSANLSIAGHLYYASPHQMNLQVPWELEGQSSAIIKVDISETTGQTYTLPLAAYSPGFFVRQGVLAARDNTTNNVITPANPAIRGKVVQLYANGLGPVTNQPASGDPAPSAPLAMTQAQPDVTIGGQSATVQFSGLAPGFAGLYQLNVVVPSGVSAGLQPVVVKIGGISSPAVNLPVQ